MVKLTFVEFDQPNQDYFMCKKCSTHIASADQVNGIYSENNRHSIRFKQVVNLEIDQPDRHRKSGEHMVADIYCAACREKLGIKYVQIYGVPTAGGIEYFFLESWKVKKKQCDKIVDGESIYPPNP